MTCDDRVRLPEGDFRGERTMLSPSLFCWVDDEPDQWSPHDDIINPEAWDNIMALSTHVALESSGYAGSVITRLNQLHHDWVFSWPEPGTAPFADYPALIAGEEFDALVFNALHGYYRQAISCLRVALETLTMAAGYAVSNDMTSFEAWQKGSITAKYGPARVALRNSSDGRLVDAASPNSVFGDSDDSWLNSRYQRLCDYSHSRAGHDNGGFWESNRPLFVPRALATVAREFRETLAVCYLLERLAWPTYAPTQGPRG